MIPNAPTLDQLRTMPIGDIVTLPSEVLAVLQEDADAALKSAKSIKDWLDGAIAQKFADRAREARAAIAKDTGIVRFTDGAITIVADLPKKVDWDQAKLALVDLDLHDLVLKDRRYAAFRSRFVELRQIGPPHIGYPRRVDQRERCSDEQSDLRRVHELCRLQARR